MNEKHSTQSSVPAAERTFTLTRVFNAPRDLVFDAWTQCEHLQHWWMPPQWTMPVCRLDFRPGGVWHYCLRGPDGTESWGRAVYQEIDRPNSFVYRDAFSDAAGNISLDLPQVLVTMEFVARGDKTDVTMSALYDSPEDLATVIEMDIEGGTNTFWDSLETYLARLKAG